MKSKSLFQNIIAFSLAVVIALACVIACAEKTDGVAYAATDFRTIGKSAYMVDVATGTVLYSRAENDRLPIASMVKIMTSLLTLESVESGQISLDDERCGQ